MKEIKHKRFMKNALVLTVSGIILRALGIVFRIWISGKIGAQGMGLYQLIISVYALASTFGTSGICTAVLRLVSEKGQDTPSAHKILRRGIWLSLALSTVTICLLITFADTLAGNFLGDTRAALSIKILGFSLPFMSVSACFRGYFLARRNTISPSISQTAEQIIRIAVTFALLNAFGGMGLSGDTAAIVVGDIVAEAAGCFIIYIFYLFTKKKSEIPDTERGYTKEIIRIALPITAGKYLNSALRTAENILVPTLVAVYTGSRSSALEQFGILKGMAMPILFFPASLLTVFSTLMIPEISEALGLGQEFRVRSAVEKTVGITVLASVFIACLFIVSGDDISGILYHSESTGIYLKALAPIVPFSYLEFVIDGILKGLDQQKRSFLYGALDSATRIVLIFITLPKFGMAAFVIIMIYSNLLTSVLNLIRLMKVTGTKIKLADWIIKPLFGGIVAIAAGYFTRMRFDFPVSRLGATAVTVFAVYTLIMFFCGEFKYFDDIIK